MRVPEAEIHLWVADYEQIVDEQLHASYRELLNPAERAQEPRFYFARDRVRYLVTRALVRTVLSRYAPAVAPEAWTFENNSYGRPAASNAAARELGLTFNISHTHSLIVLAIASNRELGVDVENVQAREASIEIAHHYFAPPEVTVLNAAPRHEQQFRFFEYWTFKESYIKARGMGLSLPLDKFSFHYADERSVAIAIDAELSDAPSRWEFWQFRPSPEYLVALCAERRNGETPRVVVRNVVPMHSEVFVEPQFLRRSNPILGGFE